jgi:hypothetical protein
MAPDLIPLVLCHGIKSASEATFMKLLKTFETSTKPTMRNTILNSLGCTQDSDLLSKFFLYAVDSDNSLSFDERNRILASANNQGTSSIRVLVKFVRENSKEISKFDLLPRAISSIASRIATRELLNEFHLLLEALESGAELSHEDSETYKTSSNVIIDWQKKNIVNLKNFFEDEETTKMPTAGTSTTTTTTTTTTLGGGRTGSSFAVLLASLLLKKFL